MTFVGVLIVDYYFMWCETDYDANWFGGIPFAAFIV